jgi:anaerobic glycerol-3-phosphate dehydrogenase
VTGPDPETLLAGARRVIDGPGSGWSGAWPTAAAALTRQALEGAVDRVWSGPTAGMTAASGKAQMVCLPAYLGDDALARETYATWCALSNACHAHPYDLPPTLAELRSWTEVVGRLVAATARRPGGAPVVDAPTPPARAD